MIVMRLKCGLGNQMFQYASGLGIARATKQALIIDDVTGFAGEDSGRTYGLDIFNILAKKASPCDLPVKIFFHNRLNEITNNLFRKKPKIFVQRMRAFDAAVFSLRDVYMIGFWQSEKYFKAIEDVVRSELSFKAVPDGRNVDMARRIASCGSVSLHVRRGDYVSNPYASRLFGGIPVGYYHEAVRALVSKAVGRPELFVFSDDIQWARENLSFEYPCTFVEHNDASKSYEDMRLMSLCKHNIIANSSFSWWGAWLNRNPGKIVIAPKSWYKAPDARNPDIIPDAWLQL